MHTPTAARSLLVSSVAATFPTPTQWLRTGLHDMENWGDGQAGPTPSSAGPSCINDVFRSVGIMGLEDAGVTAGIVAYAMHFTEGQRLYRAGDDVRYAYILSSGLVSLVPGHGRGIVFRHAGSLIGLEHHHGRHIRSDASTAITAVEAYAVPVEPLVRARGAPSLLGAITMGPMSVALMRDAQLALHLRHRTPFCRLVAALHLLGQMACNGSTSSLIGTRLPVVLSTDALHEWLGLSELTVATGLIELERRGFVGCAFGRLCWLDVASLQALASQLDASWRPSSRQSSCWPPAQAETHVARFSTKGSA